MVLSNLLLTRKPQRQANANAAGLSEDLRMTDGQYSLLVYLLFIGFFLTEVPSNMIMNKLRPSIYLSTIVWVWGVIVLAMSHAKSFEGFVTARFFLGTIEAGLFPGAIYLLTCWYTKKEIGRFLTRSPTLVPKINPLSRQAFLHLLHLRNHRSRSRRHHGRGHHQRTGWCSRNSGLAMGMWLHYTSLSNDPSWDQD